MRRISSYTVVQVKDRLNIAEVVGDHVSLQNRGGRLWACCPFHDERTPSFTVNESGGFFKCFGCGKAGDALTFVQEINRMSYYEALVYLCERYKIEITYEGQDSGGDKAYKRQESLYILLSFAQKYFLARLNDARAGHVARKYCESRDLSPEACALYGLGFAPDSRQGFLQHAKESGYSADKMVDVGLIRRHEGVAYDYFRGRLMFPLHQLSGKVVGFGARILGTNTKALKYLNSPESALYHKGEMLYGLYQARTSIRSKEQVFLVEGYMDVLAMYQAGFKETVASAGTALTQKQAQLIKRFTNKVILLLDSDTAGIQATLRGIDILLAEDLQVYAIELPPKEDPASYIKTKGQEDMAKYIKAHTLTFLRFMAQCLLRDAQDDPQKKAQVIDKIIASIAIMPSQTAQVLSLKDCAAYFDIHYNILSHQ